MASRQQGSEASSGASGAVAGGVLCTYWLRTPVPAGDAAIAAIELRGDVGAALAALGIAHVDVGAARLRDLAGIDRGVVARWSDSHATLMPHAGPAVIAGLLEACERAGLRAAVPVSAAPADGLDALLGDALTRVVSPRAVDLLLDQPRRWRGLDPARPPAEEHLAPACLRHLLREPLVVMVGPPNIGKSSLLNAMAGQGVALVADERGTTRDAVGVSLIVDGLAVRWIDTPGLSEAPIDAIDAAAQEAAREIIARADLLLIAHDGAANAGSRGSGFQPDHTASLRDAGGAADAAPSTAPMFGHDRAQGSRVGNPTPGGRLQVRLRGDLAVTPAPRRVIDTSAQQHRGLLDLASGIRSALVPDAAIADPRPWAFWL